jgi:hypothetical protein
MTWNKKSSNIINSLQIFHQNFIYYCWF